MLFCILLLYATVDFRGESRCFLHRCMLAFMRLFFSVCSTGSSVIASMSIIGASCCIFTNAVVHINTLNQKRGPRSHFAFRSASYLLHGNTGSIEVQSVCTATTKRFSMPHPSVQCRLMSSGPSLTLEW